MPRQSATPRCKTDQMEVVVELLHQRESVAQRRGSARAVGGPRRGKLGDICNFEEGDARATGCEFRQPRQLLPRLGVGCRIAPLEDGDGKKALEVPAEKAGVQR